MKQSEIKYTTSLNKTKFYSATSIDPIFENIRMCDIITIYDELFNMWTNTNNIIKIYRDEAK